MNASTACVTKRVAFTGLGKVYGCRDRARGRAARPDLRLDDEYLPLKEAALVDAIGGFLTIMVSAERVEQLLQRNSAVLHKIRKIIEDGRVIEKKN